MKKINNTRAIEKLINYDKIATLNVLGRITHKNKTNIYVDNIENPKGIILQSDYWNTIYSPYDEVAENMIKEMKYDENKGFSGVLKKYYDIIKKYKDIEWEEPCYLYYMDKDALDYTKVKHKVEALRLEHAEIVNEFYTYKSEHSLEYIKGCIKKRPSSAVFDKDGNPISWAVIREDGSMGIMYTREEYRGKGLAASVSIDLAKKVIDNNWTPYVHIVTSNTPSIALAESIGFKRYGEVMWFGIK
ncbi:GNAT family N-acetyltransferase [Caldisalinibacter kiritimatiensis]|uniref:N-acetyltransferase domain-containing protein n=1 Tax=Caldisalinibacter kiritimatiensis TaxID=1304284 RepID=R1CRT5_9FIRM|nr:GNAT family N-acetyltransferase [Caldisalinibacter kiritimatiensis]EOC99413.1 hypothetical protein L21TH_2569 [Caldisalinibacter kiritimatiensis]